MSNGQMPTVVEKGPVPLVLDALYANPVERYNRLVALRAVLADTSPTGLLQTNADNVSANVMGQVSGVALGNTFTQHLDDHWFGPNCWFRVIKPRYFNDVIQTWLPATVQVLPEAKRREARRTMLQGIVDALEVSLGLGTNETRQVVTTGNVKQFKDELRRNLPINAYWVCGKLDGFEVIVSWNAAEVSVHIVTPPVKWAAKEITPLTNAKARLEAAKKSDYKGHIARRANGVWLVSTVEGGVTPGP